MISDKDIDLLVRHLNQQLNVEEAATLRQRLANEPALKEELAMLAAMRQYVTHKDQVAAVQNNIRKIGQQYRLKKKKAVPFYQSKVFRAVAASLLLLISFAVIWYSWSNTASNYADLIEHPRLSLEKGESTIDISRGVKYYNDENYAAALPIIEQFLQTDSDDKPNFILAKGICQFELDQLAAAAATFTNLKATQAIYQDTAYWYLALIALKQQNTDQARTWLQAIAPSSTYHRKAQEILQDLQ